MTTPNPSKAQEWWHHMADELYFVDDYNDQDKFHEGVSAIIRESERRIVLKIADSVRFAKLPTVHLTPDEIRMFQGTCHIIADRISDLPNGDNSTN